MQEKLVLEIFKNFQSDFDAYKKNKQGRLAILFQQMGVSNIKFFKTTLKNKKSVGFGQKQGKMLNGFEVVQFEKNNYFIGFYENNKKNGDGFHYFINGLVYKGKYKDDIKVDGVVIDPSTLQVVYQGDWGNDTYHGRGKLTRRNKQYYEGDFVNGRFHGDGCIAWPNGDKYEGQMNDNRREGTGKFTFSSGDYYQGEFFNNKFHGHGKYHWVGGDVYEGSFENGIMTGQGNMNYSIGVIGSGVWDNKQPANVQFQLNQTPPSLMNIRDI